MRRLLKSKITSKLVAYVINAYVWLIFKTCKISIHIDKKSAEILNSKIQCVLTFWHSRILPFPKLMKQYGRFASIVSTHGDAQYLASALEIYGHKVIRGSSNRGGVSAILGMVNHIKHGDSIAITPDGPKGPRFKIKGVILKITQKYALPILPISYSASKAKILRSWDRFILPIPFKSELIIEIGAPVSSSLLEKKMMAQVMALDKKMNLKIDYR